MAATAPTGEIWLGTIAKKNCLVACRPLHVCQIWCFYHKMHDSLIFGHLAAGLEGLCTFFSQISSSAVHASGKIGPYPSFVSRKCTAECVD